MVGGTLLLRGHGAELDRHRGTMRLDEGEGVMIFPEGTSTKGEEVLPFNSSFMEFAARTDLPVFMGYSLC